MKHELKQLFNLATSGTKFIFNGKFMIKLMGYKWDLPLVMSLPFYII